MIEVRCGSCEGEFEVDDASAGRAEFCPLCGALNDVPESSGEAEADGESETVGEAAAAGENIRLSLESPNLELPPPLPVSIDESKSQRGVPAIVWWCVAIVAVGGFAWACFSLFGDDWESDHLQALTDISHRGDALMANMDFKDAGQQYQLLLDTVGNRNLQSTYLRALVARASQAHADALAQVRAEVAAMTQPTTAPATTGPALVDTDAANQSAIRDFQRCSEAFGDFLRARPQVFQDAQGNWRRRQFVAWDIGYDLVPNSDPPRVKLHYTCNSRKTEASFDQASALADNNFIHEEHIRAIGFQTVFELHAGHWTVIDRQNDAGGNQSGSVEGGIVGSDDLTTLSGLAPLEQQAFAKPPGGTGK